MTLSQAALGAASRRIWTPLELGSTALKMWLDADDATTLTLNGSKVSTWADKSGNSRNMSQGTDAQRPTTVSNVQNGHAIVRFNRSGSFSTSAHMTASTSGVSAQPYTWVMALNPTTVNASTLYRMVGYGTSGNQGNFSISSVKKWELYAGAGYAPANGTTGWIVAVGTINSTSSQVWLDGALQGTTGNAGTQVPSTLALSCALTNNTDHFVGDMGEVLFIGGTLADADRQRIEGYLAHKWGLTSSLPNDHPYKSIRP